MSSAWSSGVGLRPEGFDVTTQKQLKARIRVRMAATGERYAAARAQLIGAGGNQDHPGSVVDVGWVLRGGTDPDAAALASLLANGGVVGPDGPLSEELILLIAGGLGAGYILWEFQHDDSRVVTLGFANSAHYFDRRLSKAVTRLGLHADWSRTSGAVGAAAELRRELAAGQPVIVWPDRYLVGYWQLPAWLAALIIGVVLFVIAGIAALIGRKKLQQAAPPVPTRAIATTKADVAEIKESIHR